ncbi:hypothetical protein GPL15_05935 [Clostridium sp. MCC353]|uniref:DUF6612 family protein n=1 Tax=Clostridium sp. MCC353 TaxID=2592646 RepID=UPI001C01875A|nr:DUF6612 family protein [Clostridium sp. MCC353]MBT9776043.1 hypothetical protein [Clostridium sp. MCC353]
MKKRYKILAAALVMTFSMSITSFAGTWKQEAEGWWYQNDDGSYPQSGWQWIDGNEDGVAESYYFDENGYLLTNTTTPDGYTVNDGGAWTVDGVVQQKQTGPGTDGGESVSDGLRLYQEAAKKSSQLSSMTAASKISVTMTMEGETVTADMNMDLKFKDLNQSSMKYLATLDMNMIGVNMKGTMFYTDGYYYIDMMGIKQKVPMDIAGITAQVNSDMNGMGDDLTDSMQNVTVADDGNGNKVISYTMNMSGFNSYIMSIYDQMGLNVDSVNFKDLKGRSVINPEGYCISEDMDFVFDLTMEGQTVSANMAIQMNYINIGQPVDFTLPSTEGFTEAGTAQ